MEGRSTDRKSLDNCCETVLVEPGQEARCGVVSHPLFCLLGGNLPSKWCGRQLNLGGKSVGSDGVG